MASDMDRTAVFCIGIIMTVFFCILFAGPATLAYFFIDIGNEYSNHKCNDPVDPFDLAYWLKLEGIFWLSSIGWLIAGAIVCTATALIAVEVGLGLAVFMLVILALFGIFNAAWTVIGMVELARANECHTHAPELWNWAYAAVLVNCVFSTGTVFGLGSAGLLEKKDLLNDCRNDFIKIFNFFP